MCLAVPLQIVKIEKNFAIAKAGTLRRKINIEMLDNLKKGDYCLVHAGFAIQKLDKAAAKETLAILKNMNNVKLSK